MSDKLHRDIMNLPLNQKNHLQGKTPSMAYSLGHRDARHAAAELVCDHFADASGDAERERFEAWAREQDGEVMLGRYPDDPRVGSMAGRYSSEAVGLAWSAWQAARHGAGEKQAIPKRDNCDNPLDMVEPEEAALPLNEDAPVKTCEFCGQSNGNPICEDKLRYLLSCPSAPNRLLRKPRRRRVRRP